MRPILVQSLEPVSEPWGCVWESQGPPVYIKLLPGSTRWTAHWTSANTENPGQETATDTHCFSHSCQHTQSVSLVHHKLQVKIATRKSQLSSYSIVCGLCSVGITAWDKLGIQGWAPLSKPVGSGLGWFSWAEIGPICMFPCYIGSSGWKSQRGQDLEETGASWRTVMIMVANVFVYWALMYFNMEWFDSLWKQFIILIEIFIGV
jgi:hypothetical protein